ncbi:MAG: mismatch-specific DNA-glycosylase [Micrococcales bacterium]|nr:mismatch-specific DNA-glycosylase [Micrococcales bacterium]
MSDLELYRDATVDDVAGPGLRLLFVGINPSLWTAKVNAHFARPGNRFWPALCAAGITDHVVDASQGMAADDLEALQRKGVGITNVVARATARADELSRDELRAGADILATMVARWEPRVVAVAGITAYRIAFGLPRATPGEQAETLAGARLWVVPNPSGLNAHKSVASLAEAYAAAARAAGVLA